MAKMGRPEVENKKSYKVTIRMNEIDHDWLLNYSEVHKQTISKTMSEAFNLLMSKVEE